MRRVVLVGAGHAHLFAMKRAEEFRAAGAELVVVAPDRFWYSGLATGMLSGQYPPELDQIDVGALVERGGGRWVRARLSGLDRRHRVALLEGAEPLHYDAISFAVGSATPAIPGEETTPDCYAVKPVRRLLDLRQRILQQPDLRLVVAGGGATAFEVAASALAASGGRAQVTVLAGGPQVLRQLPERGRERVLRHLRAIRVERDARVIGVAPGRALTARGEAPFDAFVNATGLHPAGIAARLDLPVDGQGAVRVTAALHAVDDPLVFAAGDCAAVQGHDLPRVGVYAIRQAPVLHANLLATLSGRPLESFAPQRRYLWIMNLGDGFGVAAWGGLHLYGRLAFRWKDWLDRRFLAQYRV